ncbi:MAG: DUF4349 domain-containing protein [Treponema sp.]|jgi:hypothetical protein|nr:DUF4349 domain-containing protein [Treponema sp.]
MKRMTLAVIFVFIVVLTGCGKKRAEFGSGAAAADNRQLSREITGEKTELFAENTPVIQETTTRKFTTSSYLQIRIENLDGGVNKLNEIIGIYDTYASSINIYENSRSYTLKVPTQNYIIFLEEIMKIGKIINYEETTEDVTLRYYDLESRLNTKKELIKTFQSYLNKAKNMEEILSVESRLAELQAEIDDVGRQFQLLNNLIDYSTIRLELLGPISVTNYGKETIGEKTKRLMNGFGDFVSAIAVILLAIIVYGIPSIIILLLLYWVLFGKIGILKKIFKFISGNKETSK